MRQRKIYIAGPMSGYPEFNFPRFFKAQADLEARGYIVFNPANKEDEKTLDKEAFKVGDAKKAVAAGFDFEECFKWDTNKVCEARAIYLLPGWEKSVGAVAEYHVALAMKKHYPEYEIIEVIVLADGSEVEIKDAHTSPKNAMRRAA